MGLSQGINGKQAQPGVCTSTSLPPSPYVGQVIFETDTNLLRVYEVEGWTTGRLIVAPLTQIDFLVIGGGGGGGSWVAGGGGAGGYRTSEGVSGRNSNAEPKMSVTLGTTYTVTIGAGGSRAYNNGTMTYSAPNLATAGSNTVFNTVTSVGGGLGGSWTGQGASAGGSGGGRGGYGSTAAGAGTANQGFDAVALTDYGTYQETGGAGAGGANTAGGTGGVGLASSITGTSIFRGGGGGSGSHDNFTRSQGGNGGGGTGSANLANNAVAGSPNTGGGGGGGGGGGNSISFGANGGNGVVIIAYPSIYPPASSTVGSPTYSQYSRSGYHVYTFTGTGSITF